MHELYVDSNGNEAKYPGFYRKSLEKIKNAAVKKEGMCLSFI